MQNAELDERVARIEERVSNLEKSLSERGEDTLGAKRLLATDEAAQFLGISVAGLRQLTHKKLVPYYKPNGKNMYFDVDELVAWQKKNHFEPMREAAGEEGES